MSWQALLGTFPLEWRGAGACSDENTDTLVVSDRMLRVDHQSMIIPVPST
jgi:hypothetical protein